MSADSSKNAMEYELLALTKTVSSLGVRVVEDSLQLSANTRFIGIFEGRVITLYPNSTSAFSRWFTIAHLYGHMVQMSVPSSRVSRSNALVKQLGISLTREDVQLVYEHEREAAEIGRALIEKAHSVSKNLDQEYARFFHADFAYLINAIETQQMGQQVFESFHKREALRPETIGADARGLVDLSKLPAPAERIVVV